MIPGRRQHVSHVHAVSSGPSPQARSFAVDASFAGRRAWLVKVPEIVSRIAAPANATEDVIATFTSVSEPALTGASGARRIAREVFKFTVNEARASEVLGVEKARGVPLLYKMTVQPPTMGARILVAAGDTYRFEAFAAASGAVVSGK